MRLGAACVLAGALGWVWAFLATQAPSSSWHVVGLPMAVERFALHAWITGLAVIVLAPSVGRSSVLALSTVGSVLSLGAQAVSGATGLLGTQIRDARSGSAWVLTSRIAGGALLFVALAMALRQRLRDDD